MANKVDVMANVAADSELISFTSSEYDAALPIWTEQSDLQIGEIALKNTQRRERYLPPTPGMVADKMDPLTIEIADARYNRYVQGAIYYNYLADTTLSMLGIMQSNPPSRMELPDSMKYMVSNATPDGSSMEALLLDINSYQIRYGRTGIMLDVTDDNKFKVLQYHPASILNQEVENSGGADVLTAILLDESSHGTLNFTSREKVIYRVLALDEAGDYYTLEVKDKDDLQKLDLRNPVDSGFEPVYPTFKGKGLTEIPFQFINVSHNATEIQLPPLTNLANLCLHLYRLSADYAQFLFSTSQDTLVMTGFKVQEMEKIRLGSGSMIGSENPEAKVYYAGISANGLSENRNAIENLHEQCRATSLGTVRATTSNAAVSGKALEIENFFKTSLLKVINNTASNGMTNLLRIGARWSGVNDKSLFVKGSTNFTVDQATIDDLLNIWDAYRNNSLPITEEDMSTLLQKKNIIDTAT